MIELHLRLVGSLNNTVLRERDKLLERGKILILEMRIGVSLSCRNFTTSLSKHINALFSSYSSVTFSSCKVMDLNENGDMASLLFSSAGKPQISIRVLTIMMQSTKLHVKLYLNDRFSFFNYTKYFF